MFYLHETAYEARARGGKYPLKLELDNWGRGKQWVVVRPGEPAGGRSGSDGGGDGGGDWGDSSTSHHHIGERVAKDFGQNGVTDIFYGRVMTHHPAQRDQHGAMKSELFSVRRVHRWRWRGFGFG